MFVVQLTKDVSYRPLYPLTPYTSPDSLIVTNNSPAQLFIVQADTQPLDDAHAFCVNTEETVLVHGNSQPIWVRGGNRRRKTFKTQEESHAFWQKCKVEYGRSLCDKYKEHAKMVEGLSAWLDKIEQDRLAGRESVFL